MVNTSTFSLSFAGIAFLAFLLLRPFEKRLALVFGALFAAYLGLDDFATALPIVVRPLQFIRGEWNWSGKVYSLLLSTAVVLALGIKREAIGLALPRRRVGMSLVAVALLTGVGVLLALAFKPGAPSAETLAFQALMPSLAEELTYRGIAPAILLGLVRGKDAPEETPWIPVYLTALMFGIWHGLSYSQGAFSFEWIPALYTALGGVVYGWFRFTSGSLLFPMLAHSLGNVAFHLTPLIV